MEEIRRRLSWVGFLEPLSEEELDGLVGRVGFVRLEEGEVLVVGPAEQAERMLLAIAGQLQVYEVALSSGRELTLWVLGSGQAVEATGLVPSWTRDLHIRALEPSVVCLLALLSVASACAAPAELASPLLPRSRRRAGGRR
jgi:hypothetical protein